MTDHTELRKAAEAATPGPWVLQHGDAAILEPRSSVTAKNGKRICDNEPYYPTAVTDNNAAFIAAANPATIIALLDEIDHLEHEKKSRIEHANDIAERHLEDVLNCNELIKQIAALEVRNKQMEEALRFYADPERYKPHPHGPAFERRDTSYVAREALESGDDK